MHHHTKPLRVAVIAVLAGLACTTSGPPDGAAGGTPEEVLADSLVGAWLEAAGGLSTWEAIGSARYTITTVWFDSLGNVERMRPRRVEMRKTADGEQARVERPEGEGLYVQTFTGNGAWATLNGRPLPPGDPVVEETEYVGRDVVYWFGLPYKLYDQGVNRRARALDDGGYEVAVTFGDDIGAHPGDRYFYYFLDEDPFPEEVHYIEQDHEEIDRNRTVWSGFGHVGEFTYVMRRTWVDSLGKPTKELRIDDVQLDPSLADSLFATPRP